jgi:hypothetical protein
MIGVEDLEVHPIKGQGIIVECPGLKQFLAVIDSRSSASQSCHHSRNKRLLDKIPEGHSTYIIPRPGDDTAILGGTFFQDIWDTSIDYSVSRDIFAR